MAGVLLTHGAGGDSTHPVLRALEEALDCPVRRFDMPYRLAGRKAPDPPSRAVPWVARQAQEFADQLGVETEHLVVGGRSYGGRMFSVAVSEGLRVRGLLLLSYPLHPPGRPDRMRTEHFPRIRVPTLFVSGDRDPFASLQELEEASRLIPSPTSLVHVGGGHDPKGREGEIVRAVREWLVDLSS